MNMLNKKICTNCVMGCIIPRVFPDRRDEVCAVVGKDFDRMWKSGWVFACPASNGVLCKSDFTPTRCKFHLEQTLARQSKCTSPS